jgi:hypothetical protein
MNVLLSGKLHIFQIVENLKKVTWECEYVGFMLKKKFFILHFFLK